MSTIFKTNNDFASLNNVTDVLVKAGLDWTVNQSELYLENGIRVPNAYANVRDNGTVLGIVTERYTPVQNADAFDFVDALTDSIIFENAGEFNEGRFTYIQADLAERYLTDYEDEVECKLVFTNGHDGKTAVRANIVPIINGKPLNLNIARAKRNFNANHTNKVKARMAVANQTLDLAKDYLEKIMEETVNLGRISVTDKQITAFIEALFPVTDEIGDRGYDSIIEKREGFASRVRTNTALGLVLAASDFVETFEPQRKTKNFEDNRYMNFINGKTILDKAYTLVNKMIVTQATK